MLQCTRHSQLSELALVRSHTVLSESCRVHQCKRARCVSYSALTPSMQYHYEPGLGKNVAFLQKFWPKCQDQRLCQGLKARMDIKGRPFCYSCGHVVLNKSGSWDPHPACCALWVSFAKWDTDRLTLLSWPQAESLKNVSLPLLTIAYSVAALRIPNTPPTKSCYLLQREVALFGNWRQEDDPSTLQCIWRVQEMPYAACTKINRSQDDFFLVFNCTWRCKCAFSLWVKSQMKPNGWGLLKTAGGKKKNHKTRTRYANCATFLRTTSKLPQWEPAANRTKAFAVIRPAGGELKAQTVVVDSCGDKLTLTSQPPMYI